MDNTDFTVIIAAGGTGKRMKSDVEKQLISWKGHPLIYYSLKAFFECGVRKAVIVCPKGEIKEYEEIFLKAHENRVSDDMSLILTEGGDERYDSVKAGLDKVSTPYVMIHDAARPFVTESVIKNVIEDTRKHRAAIAAVPVKDTIKFSDGEGFCAATPDRSLLYQIQTPQGFLTDIIKRAYSLFYKGRQEHTYSHVTDDAMLVERYTDVKVYLSGGDYENVKITTPDDMKFLD